jgi:nucleoside-diphosphate-sugar epimerase
MSIAVLGSNGMIGRRIADELHPRPGPQGDGCPGDAAQRARLPMDQPCGESAGSCFS